MLTLHGFRSLMVRPASELVVAPLALDALSAALAKRVGFDAIYLGGGGLGYARGVSEALLTPTELAEAARAITERVDVWVVVDGSVGFGDPVHMDRTIRLVERSGAVAIEIEDQVVPKRAHHHRGHEHLVDTQTMVGRIKAACDARRDDDFVIIARCNGVSHEGIGPALERAAAYEEAGADMIMMFGRTDEENAAISRGTTKPLASMAGAGRPAAELLAAGFPLSVDAQAGTMVVYRALKDLYERMKRGEGSGIDRATGQAIMKEVGETIGMDAMYEIEAHTTEQHFYATVAAH